MQSIAWTKNEEEIIDFFEGLIPILMEIKEDLKINENDLI